MRALGERVPVRAVRGRDHVALLERAADADGDGLLADRDVEEAGQLARAETLLDLLLEAADEQHLAEEVPQLLLGRGPLLLDLRHGPCSVRFEPDETRQTMAGDRAEPARELGHCALPADGRRRDKAERAAALLAPINPGRRGQTVRFYAARGGAGPTADAVERLLPRLDEERVGGKLELVGTDEAEARAEIARASLGEAWDEALDALPADWSDISPRSSSSPATGSTGRRFSSHPSTRRGPAASRSSASGSHGVQATAPRLR